NTEPALFALFLQAMRQLHGVAATPQAIVTRMRAIHQRAVQRPASPGAVAVWLAAYGLAVAGTVLAGALVLARQARPG
ncbi:MAG: hypothetical protein MUF54_21655, partial [Polyangiaceae bacterium]|nr:hypothetical protein [Polyangiaceae bacterium]